MRAWVASANINQQSLFPTDYLNHFNEVAIVIEMLPDMSKFLEGVKFRQYRFFKTHYLESTLSDKGLAVAAYDCVQTAYLVAFEGDSGRGTKLVVTSVAQFETRSRKLIENTSNL